MERITKYRSRILLALFGALVLFFAFYLYNLQIIQTGGDKDNTTTFTTMTRVKAARGDILDTNGNVLVSNRASYDLVINHFVIKSANGTNQHLYNLVKRCQEQGIEYTEHFPVSKERPFVYTLDELNSTWQSYFQVYLASKGDLDSDITAPLLIEKLRERYDIPAEWTDEEARAVIGLWYELDLRGPVASLPNFVFLTDVDDQELSAITELSIPGMNVEASTVREYNTKYAAHILGFVGKMNAEQWEKYKDNPDYSMDSEIGQDGLEAAFEEYLHGVDGWRIDEVTMNGNIVRSYYLEGKEPKSGANVEVTVDINLQMAAEDQLTSVMETLKAQEEGFDGQDAKGAAVVAMDVRNGKVLVCASYPTYDLSTYSENFNELLEAENDPLFNRALLGTYPPGSTYKMSMTIAGIRDGLITSGTDIYDKGVYDRYAPGFSVNCLYYTNYGMLHENLCAAEALQVSCNYFYYWLGDRIRVSVMDKTAQELGLGEPTGIELPEYIGHRANEETKKELYTGENAEWYKADAITAAIGQSDNQFTPIQLCNYAATLANRGTRYKATFLNRVVSADYRSLIAQNEAVVQYVMDIPDDAILAYTQGMELVTSKTEEWTGTAYSTFADYPVKVAAKTGTAQTGLLTGSDHGAFVCYAPADDPQIAIAVYGERAGHGSTLATVARAILDIYFEVGEIGDVAIYENQLS